MTVFSKNLGGMVPLAPPGYAYDAMRVPSEKVFISRFVERKSRKRDYSV